MSRIFRDDAPLHQVIVDTSILFDQDKKHPVTPDFNRFWAESLPILPMELLVPQAVLGELAFQQITSALKLCNTIKEHSDKLAGITQTNYNSKIDEKKIRGHITKKLDKWLISLSGRPVETPLADIPWAEVIENAVWRLPPFEFDSKNPDNEKGFRDAIILETVLSIATIATTTTVVFVCNDYLLRTTAESRLKANRNFLAFESLKDFGSYIQLNQQKLTDKFVKSIQARARRKFFSLNDNNCVFLKDAVKTKIREQFASEFLGPLESPADLASNLSAPEKTMERTLISTTQFEKLVGRREFHWISRVYFVQLFSSNSLNASNALAKFLRTPMFIRVVNFDVSWKANVKSDGRFHDTTLTSIKFVDVTTEDATDENIVRRRLRLAM